MTTWHRNRQRPDAFWRWILPLCLLLIVPTQASAQQAYYVIQLDQYPVAETQIKASLSGLQPLQVYAESPDGGGNWRLKIGSFTNDRNARQISKSLSSDYPDLKVQRIRQAEYASVQKALTGPAAAPLPDSPLVVLLGGRSQVDMQLKQAAGLYGQKNYAQASSIYQLLSHVPNENQASWAFELYGVCLEKQQDHTGAMAIYSAWLEQYPDSAGQSRVRQRLVSLNTAAAEPKKARKKNARRRIDNAIYGSTSLVYRGLRRKVNDENSETAISALQADLDLHIRARTGNILVRSRVNGGYLSDYSERRDSDGRISNLYLGVTHEPSGAEVTVGRQRTNENGIYGYLDGLAFSYPVTDKFALNLVTGSVAASSRASPGSDRRVYGLGADFRFTKPGWKLQLYAIEQTFASITERRAVGGEASFFNDYSHYLLIADYDIKFNEPNNFLFNGSWDVSKSTKLSLSLGYQRSPFLTASNALNGEFDVDLEQFIDSLDEESDIYDAALAKTAISRYASVIVNQQLSERLRLIGEIYRYQLSDLPVFNPAFDTPDSDANTTFGLQFVLANAIFSNDYLSTGARYTQGDSSNSASLFIDEKLRFNRHLNLTLRLLGSRRWVNDVNRDAHTLRPATRLDWYITPTFLLDFELGYEWLLQDFESEEFKAHQGFLIMGLRKRF